VPPCPAVPHHQLASRPPRDTAVRFGVCRAATGTPATTAVAIKGTAPVRAPGRWATETDAAG
jgi:hypothetical protein